MSVPDDELPRLREGIEQADREILAALVKRMELVDRIGLAKLASASPFRDQQREDLVILRVRQAAAELGLDSHQIERLYRLIMEMSIARQRDRIRHLPTAPLRVAYQGVDGSYSHMAAAQWYGGRPGGVLLEGRETIPEVVAAVAAGEADLALLPIENTTAGSINETYDVLAAGEVTITGEVVVAVGHCLLGLPGSSIEALRAVISHPQALLQCQAFLRGASWIEGRAEFDTAGAARKVRDSGDRTLGAIASEVAARLYGLQVLARDIQDQPGNFTRFVEVAREAGTVPAEAPCKTSLMLAVGHQPGCLGQVLERFSRRSVNLTKLESRPVPDSPFRYRFYLDVEGHAASEPVAATLEEVRGLVGELRILGTYPQADPPGGGGRDQGENG